MEVGLEKKARVMDTPKILVYSVGRMRLLFTEMKMTRSNRLGWREDGGQSADI